MGRVPPRRDGRLACEVRCPGGQSTPTPNSAGVGRAILACCRRRSHNLNTLRLDPRFQHISSFFALTGAHSGRWVSRSRIATTPFRRAIPASRASVHHLNGWLHRRAGTAGASPHARRAADQGCARWGTKRGRSSSCVPVSIPSRCRLPRPLLELNRRLSARPDVGRFEGVLTRRHRPDPLTPALSPVGRGRPLVPSATLFPLRQGERRPLLPSGEKVPEGRMRGDVTTRTAGPYPARLGGDRRGVSVSRGFCTASSRLSILSRRWPSC